MTQVAIIALSVLAIFFAILAAAGVFNGSKATAPPVTTPTHHPDPADHDADEHDSHGAGADADAQAG